MNNSDATPTDEAVTRALAKELRRAREASGRTHPRATADMSSGVDHHLPALSEQGDRDLTTARLVLLCDSFGVSAPELLAKALEQAEPATEPQQPGQ
jgi:hypothetical protein